MKLSLYGIAAITMCLVIACSNGSSVSSMADSTGIALQEVALSKAEPAMSADTATATDNLNEDIAPQSGSPAYTDWDKKIIKTAKINLEVKDFKTFNASIHNSIRNFGAYTAGEQQSASDSRIENTLTIKVPVDQFDNLVNSIGGEGITMLSKDVSTDDVSAEVVDTKARMESKKQLRDKYEELLKEAKTMKDILQVQGEINGIQEELDAAAGRVSYLTHSAAYSTVTLNYYQYLNGSSADSEQPSFFTSIREAFTTGGGVMLNVLLFFVSIWPLVLAGGVLYVFLKRGKAKKITV